MKMENTGIIVTGSSGRMGSRLIERIIESTGVFLAGAVDSKGSGFIGREAGKSGVIIHDDLMESFKVLDTGENTGNNDSGNQAARGIDKEKIVVVDFTVPEASVHYAKACAEAGFSFVTGTTGFSEKDIELLKKASKAVPLLMAPNMSMGVNLLLSLARKAASVLDGWDIEILETHHRMKKDAPSGTAMRLLDCVSGKIGREGRELAVYERKGGDCLRSSGDIGMQTLRGGDVAGEHTLFFFGNGERLELTHRATSRDIFVDGAIKAASWIVNQEAGFYGMEDVLMIKG